MRTLPFLRRIAGVRTVILSPTTAVPTPGTSVADTDVMAPAPFRRTASTTPQAPAHPPVGGAPAPVPCDAFPLNVPRGAACSGVTGLRRTTTVWRPVVPRTAPARGERRGRLRLRAAVPLPGAGGRPVPPGTAVRRDRAPFPSRGRDGAAPVAAVRPMSLLPTATYLSGGEDGADGEFLVTGAGPHHTPHLPHAPAARPAPAARDTAPHPRTPRGGVPGRTH
ncbi:hypothetical protein [Streptomyces kronopolitis]|uniref:hypothetical protein n=1 Tax=Streptomyces kronopolitis TaxID=1612435 RepID=UPI003426A848